MSKVPMSPDRPSGRDGVRSGVSPGVLEELKKALFAALSCAEGAQKIALMCKKIH